MMNRIGAHEERIVSLERFGDISDKINISVVIVTYNDNPELMRCVESLASQMASDVEVIILDNGGSGKLWFEFTPESFFYRRDGPELYSGRDIRVQSACNDEQKRGLSNGSS